MNLSKKDLTGHVFHRNVSLIAGVRLLLRSWREVKNQLHGDERREENGACKSSEGGGLKLKIRTVIVGTMSHRDGEVVDMQESRQSDRYLIACL